MKLLRLSACLLGLSLAAFGQNVTLNLSGSAMVSGTSTFSLIGSGSVLGFGNAALSGAGTVDPGVLTGQTPGPITGNFSMVFAGGDVLYGSFSFPTGFLGPPVGGPCTS